jgi:hypothetical protein
MSDEIEPVSIRDELRTKFRMLCMGRPIAADQLADLLAPLFDKVTLPVLDMPADLAALDSDEASETLAPKNPK